ncbi:MAG TPA: Ku protein, partial [Acidimicrobiia bacterium]|nr:Ku protein [Acidimicrobiia bacterium]
KAYFLGPGDDATKKAYALLRDAMRRTGKAAIAGFVMRTKQYLAAIRPLEGALAVSTMLFHDEIVPVSEIDDIPTGRSAPKVAPAEVKMAAQIIESMTREWDPKRYEDTYRVQVLDFLKKKAAGEEIVVEEESEAEADVTDLMAALEASLAAAKKTGSRKAPSSKTSSSKSSSSKSRSSSKSSKPAKRSSSRSSNGRTRKSA